MFVLVVICLVALHNIAQCHKVYLDGCDVLEVMSHGYKTRSNKTKDQGGGISIQFIVLN